MVSHSSLHSSSFLALLIVILFFVQSGLCRKILLLHKMLCMLIVVYKYTGQTYTGE